MPDNTAVYAGAMPSRQGQIALEMHEMAPVPEENRYGSIHRIFTLWLNTGTLATKFENVLLFITYWVPPFAAIQIVDWWRKRSVMNVADVLSGALEPGWDALVALLAGFGAAVPFMDTSLYVGPASSGWLQGGDITFAIGFALALVVYAGIRWLETRTLRDVPRGRPVPSAAGMPG